MTRVILTTFRLLSRNNMLTETTFKKEWVLVLVHFRSSFTISDVHHCPILYGSTSPRGVYLTTALTYGELLFPCAFGDGPIEVTGKIKAELGWRSYTRKNDRKEQNSMARDNYFQSNISLRPCCEGYLYSRSHDRTVSFPQKSDIISYSSHHCWRYFASTAKGNRVLCNRLLKSTNPPTLRLHNVIQSDRAIEWNLVQLHAIPRS